MRYVKIAEVLLYLVGFCFGAYRATQELTISAKEKTPTRFTADRFAKQYQGQQWISVTGRVAIEHKFVRQSTHQAHRGKNWVYITAPIVGRDWDQETPVHVLATFGPMARREIPRWEQRWKPPVPAVPALRRSVRGQLRPGGFRDLASMFPGIQFGEPLVTINEGTEPKGGASMVFFLVLMVVMGWLMAAKIRRLWRARRLTAEDLA